MEPGTIAAIFFAIILLALLAGKGNSERKNATRTALQILETTHILANSIALDTIIGRYAFLKERVAELIMLKTDNKRYQTDIQTGLDNYKTLYYDTPIHEYQLNLLLNPETFNLINFYAECLIKSLNGYTAFMQKEINGLVRKDAKQRRITKLKEVTQSVIAEFNKECNNCTQYENLINSLNIFYNGLSL